MDRVVKMTIKAIQRIGSHIEKHLVGVQTIIVFNKMGRQYKMMSGVIQRRLLREDQVRILVQERYGSQDNFDRERFSYAVISKYTGVAASTIRGATLRFV